MHLLLRNCLHITVSCLTDPAFYQALLRIARFRILRLLSISPDHTALYPPAKEQPKSDPALSTTIPVDLVYSWVNGSDPIHQQALNQTLAAHGLSMKSHEQKERYEDNGELKLSLRSAEKFLPWINRIYIVTNGQVPDWLDTNHPKIQLITHQDIFPDPSCLPTFNSHAITFQLHRIPGLSEHFIYCCDDTFFGLPCSKEDFFVFDAAGNLKASKPRLQWTNYIMPHYFYRSAFRYAWGNVRCLLERDHPGHKIRYLFQHQAMPFTQSIIKQAIKQYPALYNQVSKAQFRRHDDIPPSGLIYHLAWLQRRLCISAISQYLSLNATDIKKIILLRKTKLLCINNAEKIGDICTYLADTGFLQAPSAFEKS